MRITDQTTGATLYQGGAIDPAALDLPQSIQVEYSGPEQRDILRARIAEQAGDPLSMLGTTSDAASLAVYSLALLAARLAEATSLSEVRAAAEPFATLSADFLAKVDAGDVKLPFLAKGMEATIAEMEARATAVTEALQLPE